MIFHTLGDQTGSRRAITLLVSFSGGILTSFASAVIGFLTHIHPDFPKPHPPIIDQLNSTPGIIVTTVAFLAVLALRYQHNKAWIYAFLAGVGIGGLLLRLV